jgi:hypothetical protein
MRYRTTAGSVIFALLGSALVALTIFIIIESVVD